MDLRALNSTSAPLPQTVARPIAPGAGAEVAPAAVPPAAVPPAGPSLLEQHLSVTPLAQGQSLSSLELVGAEAKHPLLPQELEQLMTAYNTQIKTGLENAPPDSPLARFSGTLKLMANLQDPRLQQDTQAWELLQLRRSQIEAAYAEQSQQPEVKALFEQSRKTAMRESFGNPAARAQEQAEWITSPEFKAGMQSLPPAQAQARIQEAILGLAILDPKLAAKTTQVLTAELLEQQALTSLQSLGPEGESARKGFDKALGVYLKTQQSAIKSTMSANQVSRLMQLSNEQIDELSKAVAGLAAGTQAKTPLELMKALAGKLDKLPAHLRNDAAKLIDNLSKERVLGSLSLVGSVAGLLNQEVPTNPKAWLTTTSSVLGTAGSVHHGLRLLGFHNAADLANKINYQLPVGSVKVPMLGALTTTLGIATDTLGLMEESANEDHIGMQARTVGIGSGVASLAALTLLSGPAAPAVLIGSTVVGLAAWGINSVYGESDLTGELRQQLRKSGITPHEEQLIQTVAPEQRAATQNERVALSNALLDRGTDATEDARIGLQVMGGSDAEFRDQLEALHLPRLIRELDDAQLVPLLERIYKTSPDTESRQALIDSSLQVFQSQNRPAALQQLLQRLPEDSLSSITPEAYLGQLETLNSGSLQDPNRKALLETLLTRPDLSSQREGLSDQTLLVQQWRSGMGPEQSVPLLKHMLLSAEPSQQTLAQALLSPPPPEAHQYLSPSDQTYRGLEVLQQYASRLSFMTLESLTPEQIEQLPEGVKRHLASQLDQMQPRTDTEALRRDELRLAVMRGGGF